MILYNFSCCLGKKNYVKERLDHNDRINLQAGIAKGYSLRKIAEILGKSRSTICRKINK